MPFTQKKILSLIYSKINTQPNAWAVCFANARLFLVSVMTWEQLNDHELQELRVFFPRKFFINPQEYFHIIPRMTKSYR